MTISEQISTCTEFVYISSRGVVVSNIAQPDRILYSKGSEYLDDLKKWRFRPGHPVHNALLNYWHDGKIVKLNIDFQITDNMAVPVDPKSMTASNPVMESQVNNVDPNGYSSVRYHKSSQTMNSLIHVVAGKYKNSDIPFWFGYLLATISENDKYANTDENRDARFSTQIGSHFYVIKEPAAEAVDRLSDVIRIGLQQAYEKGKEDGRALLIMLNNGEITLDELSKK